MTTNTPTRLVLLGTGTPNAEPDRAGSALAVIVDDTPYLVDCGPGVVRRANAAAQDQIAALQPNRLDCAFLTHLHSDHTLGCPDLILTPWVLGRTAPLRLFGPAGTQDMIEHVLAAYKADIAERLTGLEPANPTGCQAIVTEIEPGRVFENHHLKVDAFPAVHGSWPAYGYRFTTPHGVIVVSGDTAPHPQMTDYYADCDILVHEVMSAERLESRSAAWQQYHRAVHTSTRQLAQIATQVQPKRLVLTHVLFWGQSPADLVAEITADYSGQVFLGSDLDAFTLPE
jgi:ribonuclease BN (tRNA processing enzyme)